MPSDLAERLLLESVRRSHGRDTCDDAGRPLSTYTCEYHQGYEDGIETVLSHDYGFGSHGAGESQPVGPERA